MDADSRTSGPSVLGPLLGEGEELIWLGRPARGFILKDSDWKDIPFSLAWNGFTAFWILAVLKSDAPWPIVILPWPLYLMGIYLLAGRFVLDIKRREAIHYGITNERVIIASARGGTEPISMPLDKIGLDGLAVTEKRDGSGSIKFPDPESYLPLSDAEHAPLGLYKPVRAFEHIENVKVVLEVIVAQKERAQEYPSN